MERYRCKGDVANSDYLEDFRWDAQRCCGSWGCRFRCFCWCGCSAGCT